MVSIPLIHKKSFCRLSDVFLLHVFKVKTYQRIVDYSTILHTDRRSNNNLYARDVRKKN